MNIALPAILLNTALGAGLGFAGGLLGIGGGLIAIPMLAWLYGMDQHLSTWPSINVFLAAITGALRR